jgi:mannose-6-phosphate isomerase-like protein (cupin superfamily)
MNHPDSSTDHIILGPEDGRIYHCGPMTAIFKADENETDNRYSISEWFLQPNSKGPGAHLHESNDEVFYVIEGVVSILVGDSWNDAVRGSFIRIPANTMHDFENRTGERAAILNFFIPGGFERNMPRIVSWFEQNPG